MSIKQYCAHGTSYDSTLICDYYNYAATRWLLMAWLFAASLYVSSWILTRLQANFGGLPRAHHCQRNIMRSLFFSTRTLFYTHLILFFEKPVVCFEILSQFLIPQFINTRIFIYTFLYNTNFNPWSFFYFFQSAMVNHTVRGYSCAPSVSQISLSFLLFFEAKSLGDTLKNFNSCIAILLYAWTIRVQRRNYFPLNLSADSWSMIIYTWISKFHLLKIFLFFYIY